MSEPIQNTPARIDVYRKVLDQYGIDPEEGEGTAAEDAAEFLAGEKEIKRFCLVTAGAEYTYTYPEYDTMEAAVAHGGDVVNDSSWAEAPVSIVDLETGQQWNPDYSSITWHETKK